MPIVPRFSHNTTQEFKFKWSLGEYNFSPSGAAVVLARCPSFRCSGSHAPSFSWLDDPCPFDAVHFRGTSNQLDFSTQPGSQAAYQVRHAKKAPTAEVVHGIRFQSWDVGMQISSTDACFPPSRVFQPHPAGRMFPRPNIASCEACLIVPDQRDGQDPYKDEAGCFESSR